MTRRHTNTVIGATHTVRSSDGTTISYLSIGGGPSVLVLPGVLSMAADYAAFTLADVPPPLSKTPPWLMKLGWRLIFLRYPQSRQMLGLLHQNLREWREIARLDSSYEHYREIAAGVLLMYGGKSNSTAVTLTMERLAALLPYLCSSREFRNFSFQMGLNGS